MPTAKQRCKQLITQGISVMFKKKRLTYGTNCPKWEQNASVLKDFKEQFSP
jgi:hypothetical protein